MMRSGSVGQSTFRWAFAALFASATSAAAQVAQGVLRDSTAGTPLPGAVVMALDPAGTTVARTLTDLAGRFSIAFGRSDRLRFVRIGYTPREARIDAFEARAWAIAMVRIPPVLNAVRVAERGVCPGGGATDGAVARPSCAWSAGLKRTDARQLPPTLPRFTDNGLENGERRTNDGERAVHASS